MSEKMKKMTLIMFLWLVSFLSMWEIFATGVSFDDALSWMHDRWLTKYDSVWDFRSQDNITRWEVAKFVSTYAEVIWVWYIRETCTFDDILWYDYTLVPHIIESCKYWLLKWSANKFYPHQNMTEAEALTLIMRSVEGMQDETAQPRYVSYYTLGKSYGLISQETIKSVGETKITREKLWTWLYMLWWKLEQGIIPSVRTTNNVTPSEKKNKTNLGNVLAQSESEDVETLQDVRNYYASWILPDNKPHGNITLESINIVDKNWSYALVATIKNRELVPFEFDNLQPVWLLCIDEGNNNFGFDVRLYNTENPYETQHNEVTLDVNSTTKLTTWLDDALYDFLKDYTWKNIACVINSPLWLEHTTIRTYIHAGMIAIWTKEEWEYVHIESTYTDNVRYIQIEDNVSDDFNYTGIEIREPDVYDVPENLKNSTIDISITSDTKKIYAPWDTIDFTITTQNIDYINLMYKSCDWCANHDWFDMQIIRTENHSNNTHTWTRTIPDRYDGKEYFRIRALGWISGNSNSMIVVSDDWIFMKE